MPPASLVAAFQHRMVIGTLVSSDAAYISKAHYAVAKFAAANDKVLHNLDMIRNKSQVRGLSCCPCLPLLRWAMVPVGIKTGVARAADGCTPCLQSPLLCCNFCWVLPLCCFCFCLCCGWRWRRCCCRCFTVMVTTWHVAGMDGGQALRPMVVPRQKQAAAHDDIVSTHDVKQGAADQIELLWALTSLGDARSVPACRMRTSCPPFLAHAHAHAHVRIPVGVVELLRGARAAAKPRQPSVARHACSLATPVSCVRAQVAPAAHGAWPTRQPPSLRGWRRT
jgi:hypothetical protein